MVAEHSNYTPITQNLPVHEGKIDGQVKSCQLQSNDDTNDQQYFDPESFPFWGNWNNAEGAINPEKMAELLSFLVSQEMLQQLGVLPYFIEHLGFQENSREETVQEIIQELLAENPHYISVTDILPAHAERIKERVDLLRQLSLEETFVELSESQQYFYPGYHPGGGNWGREDMERLLSARTFLKVLQEFDALSPEQAVKALYAFSERAINGFGSSLPLIATQREDLLSESSQTPRAWLPRYMLYTSMLLAARMGEHELLINQIDEAQRLIDTSIDLVKRSDSGVYDPMYVVMMPRMVSLDDSCILTILMHASKQAGTTDTLFDETFEQKTIPLYRWDALLTHYDFAARRGVRPDPQHLVEHFDVYYFPFGGSADPLHPAALKRKTIIDTLKKRLSE